MSCFKSFTRKYTGLLFKKHGETLSVLEIEPYDKSVSGVISRSACIHVESSIGYGFVQHVTVMQKDAVLASIVVTFRDTCVELLQRLEQSDHFLDYVNDMTAERLSALETK